MSQQYDIKTINDLLGIPMDRLHDCLSELESSIELAHAMAEIASIGNPGQSVSVTMPSWTWVDDGKHDIDLSFCDLKAELRSADEAETK